MNCEYDCRDGLIFTQTKGSITKMYVCPCELGEKQRLPMYGPGDKEKKYPIYLPTYKKVTEQIDTRIKQFKND